MTWANKDKQCPKCESTKYTELGTWKIDNEYRIHCKCGKCGGEFTIPYLLVFDMDKHIKTMD